MLIIHVVRFALCSEVSKALVKVRKLHAHYEDLQSSPSHLISRPDLDWTINELRTSLRSIEWDLEDLDETLNILFRQHFLKNLYY